MILEEMDRTEALKRIGEAVGMEYHPEDSNVWENVIFNFKEKARFSIWIQKGDFCARLIIPDEHHDWVDMNKMTLEDAIKFAKQCKDDLINYQTNRKLKEIKEDFK